jgi:hypothetical protein
VSGPIATQAPSLPPDDAWSPVVLPDSPPVATLEPTQSGAGGVATTTAFRLTSLDGTPPADLAARVRIEPAVTLSVASTDGATALLRPESALRPATLYRVSLLGADGVVDTAWAAQTAGPLHLVESIPGDGATRVPPDAGIELVFDQAGVGAADVEDHLRIEPATAGRVEASGHSVVFVPARPLRRGTVYTVTLSRGLPIAGTDQQLQDDVRFRFETAAQATNRVTVGLQRTFVESTPREPASMSLWVDGRRRDQPARLPVSVHRLAGLAAAEDAWRAISDAPTWTVADTRPAVVTAGLPEVLDAQLPIRRQRDGGNRWIRLPEPLPRGWYVVTVSWAGIPRQALLQVTDRAIYALVTSTRSTVWVNDLASTAPVDGASVRVQGRLLGTTDGRGLVVGRTPDAAKAGSTGVAAPAGGPTLLEVRAGRRSAFQPLATNDEKCDFCGDAANDAVWRVIASDRYRYRTTDTVNAWGVVRDRETGAVPATLTVALVAATGDDEIPISSTTATPDANGAFAVAIPLQAVPIGSYLLRVTAGRASVGELWFQVGTITKPAFVLTANTDRRAITSGEALAVTVHGSFFEGTPVAGLEVDVAPEEGAYARLTTDADGDAAGQVQLDVTGEDQWAVQSVQVTPTRPEEAEIGASTSIAVFRGDSLVSAAGVVQGGELTVSGSVCAVDLGRFDDALGDQLWSIDPCGAARPGADVELRIKEHWTVRRRVGSEYDFVTKRVEPRYDTEDRSRTIDERTVVAGSDGRFRAVLPVTAGRRSYEVTATYTDAGGHHMTTDAWAEGPTAEAGVEGPHLAAPGSEADDEDTTYSVGDPVRLRFKGGIADPRAERYLFAVLQRGLRSVDVRSSGDFRSTFGARDVPGIEVQGVRFTGYGYEVAWPYRVRLKVTDRRLDIRISADRARYAPGDTARLTIRTLDPSGRPVAASTFVQVVDEKLFASGDAELVDPLDSLYADVGSGVLMSVRSHLTPFDDAGGEGGDTTGGGGDDGPRSDFRDWLLGRLIQTSASGTATVDVALSEDLTSWHVTAEGVDAALQAGSGELLMPVGLPFFAEATIPATLVVADHPIVRVRAFGGDLRDGEPVTFTVGSTSLGMAPVTVTGTAFRAVEVPLGALSAGAHVIRIEATARGGGLHDSLDRAVQVLPSRATRSLTTWHPLAGPTTVEHGTDGFTRLVLVDAGRGRVVPVLQELAGGQGARCDQVLAAALAGRVLADAFAIDGAAVDEAALDPFLGEDDEGLSIVPWGGVDLDVTALAAMSHDPRLDRSTLHLPLWSAAYGEDTSRARRLLGLAGLAALGDPVLQDVRAAATETDLTLEEQVNVALAALFAGDERLARTIEHGLLEAHGQHLGPWTRLVGGGPEDTSILTARLAIVAASLGEPVAAELDRWVADNPPARTVVDLERALAARGWADRVPGAAAMAAVTVDGNRRELDLEPGGAATLDLTPAQAAGARLEPGSGSVLVVITRSVPLDPNSLTAPDGMSLERTVLPGLRIDDTDTVVVRFRVALGSDAGDACWRLADTVPSGLAPVSGRYVDEEAGTAIGPDWVDGQRVEFCLQRDPQRRVQDVQYLARVVDPGTYAWEPALLQSSVAPDQGVATGAETLVIQGSGG